MLRQRRRNNKPTTLETHPGRPMILTPKCTTLVGGITQTLGGETITIKTSSLGREIQTKTTLLIIPIPTHYHLKIDSPELRLYLRAYAKRFKIVRHSEKKCSPICRIKMLPSRNLRHKLATYSSRFPATTFVVILTHTKGRSVKLSPL